MSRPIRPRIAGTTVYFTLRLAEPGATVLTDHVDALRLAVARARAKRPFVIDAFVVLPDHLHAIWTLPPGDGDVITRWETMLAQFARLSAATPPIPWRPVRAHAIRDDNDYAALLHHCWWNPVRHGLVATPEAWPWSSVHRERRNGLLGSDMGPEQGRERRAGTPPLHALAPRRRRRRPIPTALAFPAHITGPTAPGTA